MEVIRIGIVGYGNLGRGFEQAIARNKDCQLVAIFTRRDPQSFAHEKMEHLSKILNYKDQIDVLLLALGSATDIPKIAPDLIKDFNTVDCYDNHHHMLEHYQMMDQIAKETGHVAMVGTGWDPGLFSLNRLLAEAILPQGRSFTFWGKGVSQGHSDAVRRIEGVKRGVQYTIPKEEILSSVKEIYKPLSSYQTHDRDVFIVAEEGADQKEIEEQIVKMPDYFEEYHTTVHFIDEEEFERDHLKMPHGGHVIRVGETDEDHQEIIDFSLQLESNPLFTAAVATAAARAVYRLSQKQKYGAITILNTPPYLYHKDGLEDLIDHYL